LAVAAGGAEQTHSLFVRVYETVTMHLHERAASSFLRAQAIVDTVTAGKMAAAAASAAALAGSGVAVEGVLSGVPPATPQAIIRRADNGTATVFGKARKKRSTDAKRRVHVRAAKPHHHVKPPPTAAPTVRGLGCDHARSGRQRSPRRPLRPCHGRRRRPAVTGPRPASSSSRDPEFGVRRRGRPVRVRQWWGCLINDLDGRRRGV
jgi:hypothetical protein